MPFTELSQRTWDRISGAVRFTETARNSALAGGNGRGFAGSEIVPIEVTSSTPTDGRWDAIIRVAKKADVRGLSPEWEDFIEDEGDDIDLPLKIWAVPISGGTLTTGQYLATIIGRMDADPDDETSRPRLVVLAFNPVGTTQNIVLCKSSTPGDVSGVGAECYSGKRITATASGLLESFATGENVWITVLGLGGPDVPEAGRFYGAVLWIGDVTVDGDTRPRVFVQPAQGGLVGVVHVVQIDEDPWYCQLVHRSGGNWIVSDDGTGNPVDFTAVIEKDGLDPRSTDTLNAVGNTAVSVCLLYRDAQGQLFIEYPRLSSYDDVTTVSEWECSGSTITPSGYTTVRTTVDNYTAFPNIKVTQEVI